MTEREWQAAKQYLPHVLDAAQEYDVRADLLLGIGSRESAWGLALDEHGTGDYGRRSWGAYGALPPDGLGWGRGIMQIDYAAHAFARTGPWRDPRENIRYGASVLRDNYRVFLGRKVSEPLLTRAAVASYNRGPGNILRDIQRGLDVDHFTAHGNYSADVLRRAAWFAGRLEEEDEPDDLETRPRDYRVDGLEKLPPRPPDATGADIEPPDRL